MNCIDVPFDKESELDPLGALKNMKIFLIDEQVAEKLLNNVIVLITELTTVYIKYENG